MKPTSSSFAFKVGNRVKLIKIPPQVEHARRRFPETFSIFQKAVGKEFRVQGFDDYGHVELWLREDGSEDTGGAAHTVWVEPEFLSVA